MDECIGEILLTFNAFRDKLKGLPKSAFKTFDPASMADTKAAAAEKGIKELLKTILARRKIAEEIFKTMCQQAESLGYLEMLAEAAVKRAAEEEGGPTKKKTKLDASK